MLAYDNWMGLILWVSLLCLSVDPSQEYLQVILWFLLILYSLSVVLVGQVHTSLFSSVTCESLCTAGIYTCGFCAPLCFLVFASTKQKSRAKITLSFK